MPNVVFPPVLGSASWQAQARKLKKAKSITDLGDALKALAKSHDTIDFAPFELGKPAAQGDAERLQTQLAAEAKKARAVADDARTVEAQAKKLEAELKK